MKVFLLCMSCCVVFVRSHVDIDMIVSFMTLDDRPSSLLMPQLCWSQYEITLLAKALCEVGLSSAYSFQQNRTLYFLQQVVILADLNCLGGSEFVLKANEEGYFKSPYRWLILASNNGDYLDVLDNINMLVNSDVVIAVKVGDQRYLFIEAYKISENSEVIYTTRSFWYNPKATMNLAITSLTNDQDETNTTIKPYYSSSPSSFDEEFIKTTEYYEITDTKTMKISKYGIMKDYRVSKVLSLRRRNLMRHPLTMVNVITDSNETKMHLDDGLNLHQDSIAKNSYSVVKVCFEMLNATENLIFTHTWGYRDKYGNWQGLVDHLVKKEGDLGTLTIFTQDRMKSVDYIAMVGSTAVRFVFREPPLSYVSNIFTLPFTTSVWFAIFICVLGCSVFLYITSKWEASMSMHPLQLDGSWADVLILIIGAVLQQGCTLEPRFTAGRCVTLILFVALTILYAAYSANIVVLLRAPSSSVRTLPDLLNSPLKLGASDFEYNRYFFKKLNDPIRKSIYDKKIAPKGKKPNYYTMNEGVEKIRKGLFAFHMELNPGYRLIQEMYQEDEKCDLVEIDYINEIDPWIPGQKNSPFKDLFKINFIKIRESGIQSCIHHRLHVPKPRCSGTVTTFSSVGITDMYPAMLATLYGMLLAPAVLVLEIMYRRLIIIRQRKQIMIEDNNYISFQN